MRYELMLPHQIRTAIDENWPVVLPLGVLEYHSEHLAVGMDTLVVIRAAEELEKDMDLVILPPFYYGAASMAVEPPERNGTVHVDSQNLLPIARDMFRSLLRVGFRNVHFFIHHQSENFAAGMPTDLAFKLAARQTVFAFLEEQRGEGWWGDNSMANYYADHAEGSDPFSWILGHPLMTEEIVARYHFDHAGIGETSLLMSFCPEGVDMEKFSEEKWYPRSAKDATKELGDKAKAMILEHMRSVLGGPGAA